MRRRRWPQTIQQEAPGAREGPVRVYQWRWCGRAFGRRILFGACDSHECFPEIAAFEHPDEGRRRVLESVSDVLAIADAAIGDCAGDGAQEGGIMLRGEIAVGETTQR